MGRIIAIDYGEKRVGLACTDELQLIATPLATVDTSKIMDYLKSYLVKENVECIVVGEAKQLDNSPSESAKFIEPFVHRLAEIFPDIKIARVDERFTSKIAFQSMISSGLKKKQRQDKALIDTVSATLLLQTYMQMNELNK